jgi:outer membrane protein OmpA-like peptidoglycan-associated protein
MRITAISDYSKIGPCSPAVASLKCFLLGLALWCFSAQGQASGDSLAVLFEFNKAVITANGQQHLDAFIRRHALQQGNVPLALKGHCDSFGTLAYNDRLAGRRIASVLAYMRSKGVDTSIVALKKGYGERAPLTDNSTPAQRQLNRRVDLILIPKDTGALTLQTPQQSAPPADTGVVVPRKTIETAVTGQTIRLQNINFYGGRHTFLPQSMPALNDLLDIMRSYPALEIEIQGHICCMPGREDGMDYDAGDMNLSYNRAKAVFDYLVAKGIDGQRMTYRGFAGQKPLVYPERTEEDRSMNRRVEIRITRK